MRVSILFFLCLTGSIYGHCGETFHLTPKETSALEQKVKNGDAAAASRLWTYHSMSSRNEKEAAKWLRTAAGLGHPEAARWLAYGIKEGRSSKEGFGLTPQLAVEELLQKASKMSGTAANDLGDNYREGYLKSRNRLEKARNAFLLAASLDNTSSWVSLAAMLHRGEGGPIDQAGAYYYIGLTTQCIHARSVTGKELWELRRKIETHLSTGQMEDVWLRVDAYIKVKRRYSGSTLYPPALMGTGVPEKQWKEWRKETDDTERQHRQLLRSKKQRQVATKR